MCLETAFLLFSHHQSKTNASLNISPFQAYINKFPRISNVFIWIPELQLRNWRKKSFGSNSAELVKRKLDPLLHIILSSIYINSGIYWEGSAFSVLVKNFNRIRSIDLQIIKNVRYIYMAAAATSLFRIRIFRADNSANPNQWSSSVIYSNDSIQVS